MMEILSEGSTFGKNITNRGTDSRTGNKFWHKCLRTDRTNFGRNVIKNGQTLAKLVHVIPQNYAKVRHGYPGSNQNHFDKMKTHYFTYIFMVTTNKYWRSGEARYIEIWPYLKTIFSSQCSRLEVSTVNRFQNYL